jgi:hypothetical protein
MIEKRFLFVLLLNQEEGNPKVNCLVEIKAVQIFSTNERTNLEECLNGLYKIIL